MADSNFTRLFDEVGIYAAEQGNAMIILFDDVPYDKHISFCDAVIKDTASFLFCSKQPADKKEAQKLWNACRKEMENHASFHGMIWKGKDFFHVLTMNRDFTATAERFSAVVSGNEQKGIVIWLKNGADVKIENECLNFQDGNAFSFGNMGLVADKTVSLALTGNHAGILSVEMNMMGENFAKYFHCGIEYGFWSEKQEQVLVSNLVFLPESFKKLDLKLMCRFGLRVAAEDRIYFKKNKSDIVLESNFRTYCGDTIYLSPVTDEQYDCGIEFLPRISDRVNCAPFGSFTIQTQQKKAVCLLCGFSGTEYAEIPEGARVEFVTGSPAFSSYYPEREFSNNDFVHPLSDKPLTDEMVTAWMRFPGKYYTQPLKEPFFSGEAGRDILELAELYVDLQLLDELPAFPIMPYGGDQILAQKGRCWATAKQLAGYEHMVLVKERALLLASAGLKKDIGKNWEKAETTEKLMTPSGFIGEMAGQKLTGVELAFSSGGNLGFSDLSNELRMAFLESSMFCIFASNQNIGTFQNSCAVEDWHFRISLGEGSSLNDYANIFIVKATDGKIYDPNQPSQSLCVNTGVWTGKEYFSKPEKGGLANLSQWLLGYCRNAYEQREEEKCFENFVKVITDEKWRGVLALNVTLDSQSFPKCLKPLMAGLQENKAIYAHHLGADVVSVGNGKPGLQPEGLSPFFGLIYYKAEGYGKKAMPSQNSKDTYEFRLLEMNAVFDKGKLKTFKSRSQLILGELLLLKPSTKGCLYNALVLEGFMQTRNGHSVLQMTSEGDTFVMEQKPIARIRISSATMETISEENERYAFDLSGITEFCTAGNEGIDLYSYEELPFSGYRLLMEGKKFSVDVSGMSFDLSRAVLRDNSVCRIFELHPQKMLYGNDITADYSKVMVEGVPLASKLADQAAGICFQICLGTLGSLSNSSVLEAKFLVAWNGTACFAGVWLPESAMLQQVIALNFGENRIMKKEGSLIWYLSGINLKLLGLLKIPPNGAFTLALTGSGQMEGKGEEESPKLGWYAAYNKEGK